MRLTTAELEQTAGRVAAEGPIPLADAARLLGATKEALVRWAIRGKRGVRLDAVKDEAAGCWSTSAAAVERFKLLARLDE